MTVRTSAVVIVVAMTASLQVHAGEAWLAPDEISAALAGKTLEGRYATGKAFTEHYGADGRVGYKESGGFTTGGHWSITAGSFCTIYDGDASGGCFRVSRTGKNCFEFYFITRTEEAAARREHEQPAWTARGSVSGEPTSCEDGANV